MTSTADAGWGSEEPNAVVSARAEAPLAAPTKPRHNKPTTQPWQTCSKQDIEAYRKYSKLYGERKFAQEYAEQKQTLSFTDDLPAEIRLRVYDFVFHTPDDYIEFWAPKKKPTEEGKWKNLFRTYTSNKTALKIMRLNKKIRGEIAGYFYGRLNMRFSGSDGVLVMMFFNNTIKRWNCNFIKHITVHIPSGELYNCTMRKWDRLTGIQTRRGMRVPDFHPRAKRWDRDPKLAYRTLAERNYDMALRKGSRQLANMEGLKLLEILVPWDYPLFDTRINDNWEETAVLCTCPDDVIWSLSSEDWVWHVVEEHSRNPRYWASLADLKQQSSSDGLTIALVYDYNSATNFRFQDCDDRPQRVRQNLRLGRWLAAYASVMGYKFGYARCADKGAYKVRYDEDTLLSESLESLKDHPDEYDPLLEPPELSG